MSRPDSTTGARGTEIDVLVRSAAVRIARDVLGQKAAEEPFQRPGAVWQEEAQAAPDTRGHQDMPHPELHQAPDFETALDAMTPTEPAAVSAADAEVRRAPPSRVEGLQPGAGDERTAAGTPVVPHATREAEAPAADDRTLSAHQALKRTARAMANAVLIAAAVYFAVVLVLIVLYRFVDPPASTLTAYRYVMGEGVDQRWVGIEAISPEVVRAVIVAEDWRFCQHNGVDLAAIGDAIENAGDGIPRGASTISMQVTKNLFLTQSKSYARKAVEIPLTLITELIWPKARILEIYLNIAEFGPGVFGVEAAARHHFGQSAAKLDRHQAALLASVLPNPIIRDAGDPGPLTAKKARVIQARARASGGAANCVLKSVRVPKAPTGWRTRVRKSAPKDHGAGVPQPF